jgi:glyoxylase-like metal-dependent hydrolase (beta-lactamase superfamily II)
MLSRPRDRASFRDDRKIESCRAAAENQGGQLMRRISSAALAGAIVVFAGTANAQQNVDFSKVEVKTTDLGNKTYRLEGAGGNVTVAVGSDGIIMVDGQFAPMHDKLKAAIEALSNQPIKYLINTHFHGDHVGGNGPFQADGAVVVAQDNIRIRLAAGTKNGITGVATPPVAPGAVPKQTYTGGSMTLSVGGRTAQLTHVNNAHTDGDTWVYFADANVLCTGDTMNNTKRYQTIDYANGGDIRGMIRATEIYLKLANDDTRVVVGHGPLAKKADIAEFHDMLVIARDRIEKLVDAGKSEQEVIDAKPLADLDAKWAATEEIAKSFTKMVYNSFKRS